MAKEDWRNIDLATLTAGQRAAWDEMKAAYRLYAQAKTTFEDVFSEQYHGTLPSHLELKFGYNFGKLAVAVGPKREGKAKVAEVKDNLMDWLAQQVAHGRSV